MKKMKYKIAEKSQEKRQISTCNNSEAFLWNDSWYIRAELRDGEIQDFGDFFEANVIEDGTFILEEWDYTDYIPIIDIRTHTLHYMHERVIADGWADIQLSIMPK